MNFLLVRQIFEGILEKSFFSKIYAEKVHYMHPWRNYNTKEKRVNKTTKSICDNRRRKRIRDKEQAGREEDDERSSGVGNGDDE